MNSTTKVYRSFVNAGESKIVLTPNTMDSQDRSDPIQGSAARPQQNQPSIFGITLKTERVQRKLQTQMLTKRPSIEQMLPNGPNRPPLSTSRLQFKNRKQNSPQPKMRSKAKTHSIANTRQTGSHKLRSLQQMSSPRAIQGAEIGASQSKLSTTNKSKTESSNLGLPQTKSPCDLEMVCNINTNGLLTPEKGLINRTNTVADLARQVNQKQSKISELQKKLFTSRNNIYALIAEHARQLTQKQRQNGQLRQARLKLQKQLKDVQFENSQLKSTIRQKQNQIMLLKENQDAMGIQLSELKKVNQSLEQSIRSLNQSILHRVVDQQLIGQIKEQLGQKTKRIQQLQDYNQSLLIQLQRVRQEAPLIPPLPPHLQSRQDEFSLFEDLFKTYLSQSQKYKTKIQEKDQEIETIKEAYNAARIQNQHLKNELRIEELRWATDLRNNGTIMQIQRQFLLNELKDVKHQLSISKERTKTLSDQIKTKDQFIMRNIKVCR